jgi:hypothetical protein
MKRFSLCYSLLTYRLDQLWFPLAFWALFAVMSLLMRVRDLYIARAYLGCAIPLVGGIMAAYAVLDDPALELRFATPVRPAQTLLERLDLIFLVQAVCAFGFQALCLALGVDLSILGNWFAVQLAWLVPTLALMALGTAGSLMAAQTTTGAFLVGIAWIVELIARGWFAANRIGRYFLIFMGALMPDHPVLSTNQASLLALAALLFVAAWALLHRQERYI